MAGTLLELARLPVPSEWGPRAEPSLLRRVAVALLAVDGLLLLLSALTGGANVVNLDAEANIPTWYSSAKLLGIAALCVAAFYAEAALPSPPREWRLWLLVGFLFAALSLDETAGSSPTCSSPSPSPSARP